MTAQNRSSITMPGVLLAVALLWILAHFAGSIQTRTCTRPDGLRPAPLRLPPCELAFIFDFEQVTGAARSVLYGWFSEHQSFPPFGFNLVEKDKQVLVFKNNAWRRKFDRCIFVGRSLYNSRKPSPDHFGSIKHHELDRVREMLPAALRGEAGGLQIPATSPNLAVQLNAIRQRVQEPVRRINAATRPAPERFTVPIGTASVVFLRRDPARDIFTGPIASVLQHQFRNEHEGKLPDARLIVKAANHV